MFYDFWTETVFLFSHRRGKVSQKRIYGWGWGGECQSLCLVNCGMSPYGNHSVGKMGYWAVSRYGSLIWVLRIRDQQEWASVYGKRVWQVLKVSGGCGVKSVSGLVILFLCPHITFITENLVIVLQKLQSEPYSACRSHHWECFDSLASSNSESILGVVALWPMLSITVEGRTQVLPSGHYGYVIPIP